MEDPREALRLEIGRPACPGFKSNPGDRVRRGGEVLSVGLCPGVILRAGDPFGVLSLGQPGIASRGPLAQAKAKNRRIRACNCFRRCAL